MRARRGFAERIEIMVNTTKLTLSKNELNDKLIDAVRNRDVKRVKELLAKGADVDVTNKDSRTALHEAAYYGNVGVAKVLTENRADVNARDKNNETAVEVAIRCDRHQIAELIDDSIKHRKALDILNIDMDELVRMADESAKRLCRKD